jgi:hypothetical protein
MTLSLTIHWRIYELDSIQTKVVLTTFYLLSRQRFGGAEKTTKPSEQYMFQPRSEPGIYRDMADVRNFPVTLFHTAA